MRLPGAVAALTLLVVACGSGGDSSGGGGSGGGPVTTITFNQADPVSSVIQLADGNIASADNWVRIWDPAKPDSVIATYTGHTDSVISMVQLADGNIASASADGTVQIWDPAKPDTAIATDSPYGGTVGPVPSVIQLANGNIATASYGVEIWDPGNPGTTIATYTNQTSLIYSLIELADGNLAFAGDDGTVQIWDLGGSVASTIYVGHSGPVYSVIQLSDGNIASASADGTVQIWDPANPGTAIATYTGHASGVTKVVELASGNIASASGDSDGKVEIWDPANPNTTIATYTGHTGPVYSLIALANGNIASAGADGTVQIWDPTTVPPLPEASAGPAPELADLEEAIIDATNCVVAEEGGRAVADGLVRAGFHLDADVPDAGSFTCVKSPRTDGQASSVYLAAHFADEVVVNDLLDGQTPLLCQPVGVVGPWLLVALPVSTPSPELQSIVQSYGGSMIVTC